MNDPFESPKFLLRQTQIDIIEFDTLWEGVLKKIEATNIIDINPLTGNKTYKVRLGQPLPERARHLAGNAVNNLRHALDQALSATVGADADLIYFPFATSPKDLIGRLDSAQYERVPDKVRTVLKGMHLYPTGKGHEGGDDILSGLTSFAGKNKHRVTLKVAGAIARYRNDDISMDGVIDMAIPPAWDMAKNELIIGTTRPHGHIQYSFEIAPYPCFSEAGSITGRPVSPTIKAVCGKVGEIVAQIEAAHLGG